MIVLERNGVIILTERKGNWTPSLQTHFVNSLKHRIITKSNFTVSFLPQFKNIKMLWQKRLSNSQDYPKATCSEIQQATPRIDTQSPIMSQHTTEKWSRAQCGSQPMLGCFGKIEQNLWKDNWYPHGEWRGPYVFLWYVTTGSKQGKAAALTKMVKNRISVVSQQSWKQ